MVSIDNGSHAWEIVCKSVKILRLDLQSKYFTENAYPNPAFVLEGVGWVQVDEHGTAVIS